MFNKILKTILGSKNERELKRIRKIVKVINGMEEDYQSKSDAELRQLTADFKKRVSEGESLDAVLPEAFAAVREASRRAMGMRHFDVQLIGGVVLHEGKISEMRTGEGKTLMATLAVYLNALSGKGVHVVTVNDYLAQRDADWMRPLYEALDLSVGVIKSMQDPREKKAAYESDITYGTNNEFGFDYLRDNMALRKEERMQRTLNFAIVDEVDSILIDEARTPLIISGAADDNSQVYKVMNKLIPSLKEVAPSLGERNEKLLNIHPKVMLKGEEKAQSCSGLLQQAESNNKDLVIVETGKVPVVELAERGHYAIDEKSRSVELTEEGHELVESLLVKSGLMQDNDSLYSAGNLSLLHHVHSALKAHKLFHRDVEYMVQEGQVVLIDEHTGRTMPGRRLSEGLHQAIEAKEGVQIQAESQTMASTTFQNYFRLYNKLAGMTGTADTEAFEFKHIYGLEVVVIPTNKDIARQDLNDLIYMTMEDKYEAVVNDVQEVVEKKAPVLIGTASVETSELMSKFLKKAGIKHEVLNAKFHEREAEIIAQAGRPGAVTIATNMAGRGTDIVLGGKWEAEVEALKDPSEEKIEQIKTEWKVRNQQVKDAGGLHIIGTERHESRRIDNQLRGRAGRQGDPGVSRFYLSLEDNLMRIFASDRMRAFMQAIGMEKGEAIEHRMVTNSIEKAQRKVEGRNFDYRKQLLEYDDVANDQRRVIYQQRNELLEADDIADIISGIREDVVDGMISSFIPPQSLEEQWDISGLEQALENDLGLKLSIQSWLDADDKLYEETLREKIRSEANAFYEEKAARIGEPMRMVEKQIMLQVLDTLWKEHLQNMDHLRQGIGLRAYAQKNPKQEYKREAFEMFQGLLETLKFDVTKVLYRLQPMTQEEVQEIERRRREEAEKQKQKLRLQHARANALASEEELAEMKPDRPYVRSGQKVGRNDPCPCGSGKKYKSCHGKLS